MVNPNLDSSSCGLPCPLNRTELVRLLLFVLSGLRMTDHGVLCL